MTNDVKKKLHDSSKFHQTSRKVVIPKIIKTNTGFCLVSEFHFSLLIRKYFSLAKRPKVEGELKREKDRKRTIVKRLRNTFFKDRNEDLALSNIRKEDVIVLKWALSERLPSGTPIVSHTVLLDALSPFFFEFRDTMLVPGLLKSKIAFCQPEFYANDYSFVRPKNIVVRYLTTFLLKIQNQSNEKSKFHIELPQTLAIPKAKMQSVYPRGYQVMYRAVERSYDEALKIVKEKKKLVKVYKKNKSALANLF
jgi:hypothetical protein